VYSSAVCYNTYDIIFTKLIQGWDPIGMKKDFKVLHKILSHNRDMCNFWPC